MAKKTMAYAVVAGIALFILAYAVARAPLAFE